MLNTARLTKVALALNAAAGTDKYDSTLTVPVIKDSVREGTILNLLETQLGTESGLASLKNGDREELLEEWRGLVDNAKEDARLGVHRGGLNLLVAYILWGLDWRCDQS